MMVTDIELQRQLTRAMATQKYLITVSHVDEDKKQIQHYYKTVQFPREDVLPTINKLFEMLESEVAEIEKGNS